MPIFNRITYGPVETEAYAVFDSSDGSFIFFRDDKGKYTDGQISGTKTYYRGFEDITGKTYPSWYDSFYYAQKNRIETVAFKDKIQPKTCYGWFSDATVLASITGLDNLDTSRVTNMSYMFCRCNNLTSLDVSSFNTKNVTNMNWMFDKCNSLTSLDVSSFNTEKVTDMYEMFYNCSRLKTIYASSLFTTDAVKSSNEMFKGCTSLVGGAGTKYDVNYTGKTYARIDGGTSNPGYFTAKQAYAVYDSTAQSMTFFKDTPGKYTDGQVSGTKTYYTGFEDITEKTKPSWLDVSSYEQKNTIKTVTFKDKISPKTCYWWFYGAVSLTSITGLDKLDTAAVTNMNSMFYNCNSLTSLDLSSFNTKNVTNMGYMFQDCKSLTSLDVSSFNTENVTKMYSMFQECNSINSLDVSSFNTAKVTDMSAMFQNCKNLTSLDLSSFNTENVKYMLHMFSGCFKLKTIYASSLFTTNMIGSSVTIFINSISLVGGAGTKYDRNHTNKTYARIDGGTSNPGYFTAKAAPAKANLQR